MIPDPLNPAAWNRFSYVYGNPVNLVDPSGHFAIAPWDFLDIISFGASLNDFVNDPSLANAGWLALDTISLLPLIPALGAIHHVGKLDDLGDARRVVVELGSGDFTNLPHIIADNSDARVIGIEHPDLQFWMEQARAHPALLLDEDMKELAQVMKGYEVADKAGAEIHFLDFGGGLPFKVDEIISIAPNPSSVWDVTEASLAVKPGGRIYIATVAGESTGRDLVKYLSKVHGIEVPKPKLGQSRYPSKFFAGNAEIIDFIMP